ncbi:acyltransferase [Odoribacter sp. OttesenSCG-928-J03]|nr:acyltransferase [Odoribacter sp. OttesenSCG-928-J03]MDL2330454.1 acyltransferase [Odoribacter sp. OttesenSCG-928-A06]
MENNKKELLLDVTILRPVAILLLVVYHAFIVYRGGWSEPVGYLEVRSYKWIADVSYSFMLEIFVMLSGYVFGYQLYKQKRIFTLPFLIKNKFKRLILPSVIFSTLYFIIFKEYTSLTSLLYNLINGVGHMWFLPMLFWCFLGGYLMLKLKLRDTYKLPLAIVLVVFSILPLPFRLESAFYYFFFFYLGMMMMRKKEILIGRYCKNKNIILLGFIFVVVFIAYEQFFSYIRAYSENGIICKILINAIAKYWVLTYAVLGCLTAYLLTNICLEKIKTISPTLIWFNQICFGVYLFQQFILQILYYKTSLPSVVGPYYLPWIGLLITLVLSILLSQIMRFTKVGRFLIG